MAQLRLRQPDFGKDGKQLWQQHPSWQPLRRASEELLCTYDWGEALVALNLCMKPVLDELFLNRLAELARASNDFLLGQICFSLAEDAGWHRAWSEALIDHAVLSRPDNLDVVREWVGAWLPKAEHGARVLTESWDPDAAQRPFAASAWLASRRFCP
jgi:toluene monooxygenase system protein E